MPISFWIVLACIPFVSWWLAGVYIKHADKPLRELRAEIEKMEQ